METQISAHREQHAASGAEDFRDRSQEGLRARTNVKLTLVILALKLFLMWGMKSYIQIFNS